MLATFASNNDTLENSDSKACLIFSCFRVLKFSNPLFIVYSLQINMTQCQYIDIVSY